MSKIDTKVDRLSDDVKNLQTDLNDSHNVQHIQVENQQESLVDGTDPKNQKKIVRFAQMLKKLNGFKTKYKTASSETEKQKVHQQVMDFTKQWLDTKNVQLSASLAPFLEEKWEINKNTFNHRYI